VPVRDTVALEECHELADVSTVGRERVHRYAALAFEGAQERREVVPEPGLV